MKRVQFYLDEAVWKRLRIHSGQRGATISELVCQAVREKYGMAFADRRKAMQGLVGFRRNRKDLPDSETCVRRLRAGRG